MPRTQPDAARATWPKPLVTTLLAFLRAWGAGLALGGAAFLIGFVFGVIRVVVVAPAIGAFAAVGIELVVFLPLLALVSEKLCKGLAVNTFGGRYTAGLMAWALLLVLEACFAIYVIQQSCPAYLRSLATPQGLLGLAGQTMLVWLPAATLVLSRRDAPLGLDQGASRAS